MISLSLSLSFTQETFVPIISLKTHSSVLHEIDNCFLFKKIILIITLISE